jgi:NAD(P)-dependent dehydrogenase (short-subunit alcohol dehydrogenase family)
MTESAERIAVVTGAGTGVGRAITRALLDGGFSVVLAGRREAPLREAAAALDPAGTHTLAVAADIGKPADVEALFAAVRQRFGRLDLLVNNAGTNAPPLPLEELSFEQWQAVVDTNLTGAFLCTQQAFRMMKAQNPQGGRIINNGSISAHVPRPNSVAYTATKHAMTGLTRCTALDGRPFNIACGQIDIGNADTEMAQAMKKGVRQANGSIAVEPTMDVEHVGRAVGMMAGLPLDANVQFITIMATGMPYIGRG